jgi:hypothetical protein
MISEIIKLSQSHKWIGVSENVEIAKGKYKKIYTWGGLLKQIKRQWLKK